MESKPKTFGEWLREKRAAAGLSLQEVADRAGVSKGYLSNVERNAPHSISGAPPKPSQQTVDAIAEAVGAPIAEARLFAGYAAPQTEADANQSRLLFYFNDLPASQRDDALALVETLWRRQHAQRRAERQAQKESRTKKSA